jgi:hypothetical protein
MENETLTIRWRLTVDIDGKQARDIADDLAIDADAGELDQAVLNLLRDHLRKVGDTRDWRIVRVEVQP